MWNFADLCKHHPATCNHAQLLPSLPGFQSPLRNHCSQSNKGHHENQSKICMAEPRQLGFALRQLPARLLDDSGPCMPACIQHRSLLEASFAFCSRCQALRHQSHWFSLVRLLPCQVVERPECGPPAASQVPIDGCSAGLTAAVIDETLGGLIYMLKRDGSLPPGPAFTVHLEVDYKAVSCTSSLDLDCPVVCYSIIHSVQLNICSRSSTACAVIGSWCRCLQRRDDYYIPAWSWLAHSYEFWLQSVVCMVKRLKKPPSAMQVAALDCGSMFVSAGSMTHRPCVGSSLLLINTGRKMQTMEAVRPCCWSSAGRDTATKEHHMHKWLQTVLSSPQCTLRPACLMDF